MGLTANNLSYGLLTPGLGFLMSCLGAFLGLRCASRALACSGPSRARWLMLAALAFGTTCIWVMHFIAMLGYTIPGETILYNVPQTMLSMVIAVLAVGIALFTIGFGRGRLASLLVGGVVAGAGVASVHYVDMAGMRMPAGMDASPMLLVLTVLIAVAGATALLWAVPRLHGGWPTAGAALIAGAFISGLHYTGMAGMHLHSPGMGAMSGMSGGGETALGFLLPLIIGISVIAFILTAILALSPSDAELRAEARLLGRTGGGGRHRKEKPGWQLLTGAAGESSAPAGPPGRAGRDQAVSRAAAPGSLFVSPAAGTPAGARAHGRG